MTLREYCPLATILLVYEADGKYLGRFLPTCTSLARKVGLDREIETISERIPTDDTWGKVKVHLVPKAK